MMINKIKNSSRIILCLFFVSIGFIPLESSLRSRLNRRNGVGRRNSRQMTLFEYPNFIRARQTNEVSNESLIIDNDARSRIQENIPYGRYLVFLNVDVIVDRINNYENGILDLSGFLIDSSLLEVFIPFISSLVEMRGLTDINLSNNSITFLPSNWSDLNGLVNIDLSHNNIIYFNRNFNRQDQGRLVEDSLERMSFILSLESLNLSGNENLQYFPFNLRRLGNFNHLDLSDTRIIRNVMRMIVNRFNNLDIQQD